MSAPRSELVSLLRAALAYVPPHDGYDHNPYLRERENCKTCRLRAGIERVLKDETPHDRKD